MASSWGPLKNHPSCGFSRLDVWHFEVSDGSNDHSLGRVSETLCGGLNRRSATPCDDKLGVWPFMELKPSQTQTCSIFGAGEFFCCSTISGWKTCLEGRLSQKRSKQWKLRNRHPPARFNKGGPPPIPALVERKPYRKPFFQFVSKKNNPFRVIPLGSPMILYWTDVPRWKPSYLSLRGWGWLRYFCCSTMRCGCGGGNDTRAPWRAANRNKLVCSAWNPQRGGSNCAKRDQPRNLVGLQESKLGGI